MTDKPRDAALLAAELARTIVPKPIPANVEMSMSERQELFRHAVEQATRTIALMIEQERRQTGVRCYEECARVAESEFSQNPSWDRPKYSSKAAGDWIATCIRSLPTSQPKTNTIHHHAERKGHKAKKHEEQDEAGG